MSIRTELEKVFEEKYANEIATISREHDVDLGVARDHLIANARNRNKLVGEMNGDESRYYKFTGCETLDYEALDAEIKVLEDNFVIPKEPK